MSDTTTIVLPSKGALAEPTLSFLKGCGLKVWKPNPRQYTGAIPSIDGLNVMFQRVKDVVYKVADGTAELGITGLDVVYEYGDENIIVIHPDLEYGHCRLLVAVPEAWVDVESMIDIADIAHDLRETQHRNLRVATTYTRSARQFLHEQGIHHFSLVRADGAIEAAPTLGYADIVVDLTQTGTTIRENRLKEIPDGVILSSQACLIGNRTALLNDPHLIEKLRLMLETMDASLLGRRYFNVIANIPGESADEIAEKVTQNPITTGLQGPTIAPVYGAEDRQWFSVTVIVRDRQLLSAVEYLRSVGGNQVVAYPTEFVFMEQSETFERLQETLAALS
ncbi:MAG: ATP phosphoribosyltransferase [Chloroflexota bacterium]